MANNFYAKIFIATAVIFPLFVVDGSLRVQISGHAKKMPEENGGKVKNTSPALPKPGDKLHPANAHLRILLARTKEGVPAWETAQQAKVGMDGKYKFDFEVTDPDIVGTQYTWGVAADKRIFELQTLSNEPVKLKVLKKMTKKIDIYADITGSPIVGLNKKAVDLAKGAAEFNKEAGGIKVELVKLVDPSTRKDLETQFGITKQITDQPPPEEEPKQKRSPFGGFKKAPWEGSRKDETPLKEKVLGSISKAGKGVFDYWRGGAKGKIHPVADTGSQEKGKPIGTLNGSQAEEQQSQQSAPGKTDEHPTAPVPGEANHPANSPAPKSGAESGAES